MARASRSESEKTRGIQLAVRIKQRRESLGLSQPALSNVSGVGLDTLRAIEGKRVLHPGVFTLSDIASALSTKLETLVPPKTHDHSNHLSNETKCRKRRGGR